MCNYDADAAQIQEIHRLRGIIVLGYVLRCSRRAHTLVEHYAASSREYTPPGVLQ